MGTEKQTRSLVCPRSLLCVSACVCELRHLLGKALFTCQFLASLGGMFVVLYPNATQKTLTPICKTLVVGLSMHITCYLDGNPP